MLTPGEVDEFFGVVRGLVDKGKSIIFITHKLREVLAVADRITVLRGGLAVGTADPATATEQDLANLMVGAMSSSPSTSARRPRRTRAAGHRPHRHRRRGVTTVSGLDLTVRAGEIFGIAGVEGNGERELVEAVTGMRTATGGTVSARHRHHPCQPSDRRRPRRGPRPRGPQPPRLGRSVLHRRQRGAEPLPQRAVLAPRPPSRGADPRAGPHDRRAVRHAHAQHRRRGADALRRQPAEGHRRAGDDADDPAAGGGQPTRGLDVGSIEFIHRRIVEMRDNGAAVLLVSAELDEILSLSDRVGVLYRGRLVGEFDRDATLCQQVGLLMASGRAVQEVSA